MKSPLHTAPTTLEEGPQAPGAGQDIQALLLDHSWERTGDLPPGPTAGKWQRRDLDWAHSDFPCSPETSRRPLRPLPNPSLAARGHWYPLQAGPARREPRLFPATLLRREG